MRPPGAAVYRPAGHSAAPAAGLWPTISFGQFAFCSALSACAGGAGVAERQAQAFYHHSWRSSLANAYRGKLLAGIALLAIFGVLVLVGGSLAGSMSHWWAFYADPGGGAQLACGNIFNKKIMSQATRLANHIAGGVSALIPVLRYVCLVVDHTVAAHAGESTPDRYADGSRCFTWCLSPPSSAGGSGAFAAGAL